MPVQTLVHVLAALALMGLGCLWLLMNLSAEFAHARRDMRELPGRSPTTLTRVSRQQLQERRLSQAAVANLGLCRATSCKSRLAASCLCYKHAVYHPSSQDATYVTCHVCRLLTCLLATCHVLQDVLNSIQDAPYSTSPKKGMVATKTAARDQVCAHSSHQLQLDTCRGLLCCCLCCCNSQHC